MNKRSKLIITTLLFAGALSVTTMPVYAKSCKSYVTATGDKKSTWFAARANARKAWRKKVGNSYGWRWKNYARANNKTKHCWQINKRKRQCTFGGNPCKL